MSDADLLPSASFTFYHVHCLAHLFPVIHSIVLLS